MIRSWAICREGTAMLPFASLWPQPNGPELLVNGLPTGTRLAYYNPRQPIHEDFGVDLLTAETGPWPRLGDGCNGAFVHLKGRGDWL